MTDWTKYLRMGVIAENEGVVTAVIVTSTATEFSSQLTGGQTRKLFSVYNNSESGSGECYYGYTSAVTSANGFTVPKGSAVDIPVSVDISVYFISETGEQGDFRVEELS